jgi:hypothetical protein
MLMIIIFYPSNNFYVVRILTHFVSAEAYSFKFEKFFVKVISFNSLE